MAIGTSVTGFPIPWFAAQDGVTYPIDPSTGEIIIDLDALEGFVDTTDSYLLVGSDSVLSSEVTTSAGIDSVLRGQRVGDGPPLPPIAPEKEWGLYVFQIAGHGLGSDFLKMNQQMNIQGTSSEAHIVIRAQDANGRLINLAADTADRGQKRQGLLNPFPSGPGAGQNLAKPILDKDAMGSFLAEAAERFPSEKICVSFEGHSGQLRQAIPQIHAALEELTARLGRKIGILLFDSCFMAQIELATEFSDVARFLVASQEGVVKFRSFPLIARWLASEGETSAEQLAKDIALKNEEFTFSAVDLEKVTSFNQAMRLLGEEILLINDDDALDAIRKAARRSTGYYTEGLFQRNHFSNTIDLYGFIKGIEQDAYLRRHFNGLVTEASNVLRIFGKEGKGLVIAERHARNTDQYVLDYTDVRGSHGLSIHQRITPKWLWNAYTHLENSRFNEETNWDKVTDHITSQNTTGYIVGSLLSFAGGAITAGVNNGIQRGMELWEEAKGKIRNRLARIWYFKSV